MISHETHHLLFRGFCLWNHSNWKSLFGKSPTENVEKYLSAHQSYSYTSLQSSSSQIVCHPLRGSPSCLAVFLPQDLKGYKVSQDQKHFSNAACLPFWIQISHLHLQFSIELKFISHIAIIPPKRGSRKSHVAYDGPLLNYLRNRRLMRFLQGYHTETGCSVCPPWYNIVNWPPFLFLYTNFFGTPAAEPMAK